MKKYLIVSMVIAALLIVSAVAFTQISAGTTAPDFTLPTIDGKTFTLSDNFKAPGKVVLLDIWATWCGPCRAEIPYLVDLSKKFQDKDVTFVGVAIDSSKSTVESFAKSQNICYTVATDPNQGITGSLYKVRGVPSTYIIDRKGVIRFSHIGFSGKAEIDKMESEINTLLAEK